MTADLTPAGAAAVRLALGTVELKRDLERARSVAVALEQQLARVEALCRDHERLTGYTFMGSPFPPAVTIVDLRAALEADDA